MPLGTPLINEINNIRNDINNLNTNLNTNFINSNKKFNYNKSKKNIIIINKNNSNCVRKISDYNYIF